MPAGISDPYYFGSAGLGKMISSRFLAQKDGSAGANWNLRRLPADF